MFKIFIREVLSQKAYGVGARAILIELFFYILISQKCLEKKG